MSVHDILMAAAGAQATGPTDPFWSNVDLLLHCEGTNGSTSFPDSSSTPKTVTASGPTVDTSWSAAGSASALIASATNTGNVLTLGTAISYAGDFTFEAYFHQTARNTTYVIAFLGTTNEQFGFDYSAAGTVFAYTGTFTTPSAGVAQLSGSHHVAWCRSGSTLRLFYDGALVASGTFSGTVSITKLGGYTAAGYSLPGNMDEIRMTSAARYTAAFTPPSVPFPNA